VDRSAPINNLALCAGVGGLELGLDLGTGGAVRTVCYVEREAHAAAVLARRMEEKALAPAPVWSDLRTFDGRPWRGIVDCISGGYPCQPFSHAGRRLGSDDPRHLWPSIARIIAEVEPGLVFFENVAGHLSLGFADVRRELEGLGFGVTAGLFTAAEVGAPHKRQRLFILGIRAGGGCGEQRQAARAGRERHADGGNGGLVNVLNADGPRCTQGGRIKHHNQRRELGSGCENLADAGGERPQGLGGDGPAAGATGRSHGALAASAGRIPLFPPGPGDIDGWRRVLEHRPDLAPAVEPRVRRVADGLAGRLDRLRACGNGVVPLEAAYAFVTLWACLREESQ
jgi:DNA (cytosine-5)-methyltransferase 1